MSRSGRGHGAGPWMHRGRLTTRGDPLSYAALRDPAAPREEATGHRLQVRCRDPPPACPGPAVAGWQQRNCSPQPTPGAWGSEQAWEPVLQRRLSKGAGAGRLRICSTAGPCRLLGLTHPAEAYGEGAQGWVLQAGRLRPEGSAWFRSWGSEVCLLEGPAPGAETGKARLFPTKPRMVGTPTGLRLC